MNDGKQRIRTGFTLIELLVVIAIMAVLAALLVPTLSVALRRARQSQCLSNVRQIAQAATTLFDNTGDRLPYRTDAMDWGQAAEQLLPYLADNAKVFDCPANPGNEGFALCRMTNSNASTDYELNGYLCTSPGHMNRRQNMITSRAQAAYIYDFPYRPDDVNRAHKGGVNCGYVDGHAAWVADADMGPLAPDNETTLYKKGHICWRY